MKQGTLFIAPIGARNKKETVFQEIVSLLPGNDYSSVLYLCPNTVVQSSARRLFFSYLKKVRKVSAHIPFQAFTIKQLALHIHEITPPSPPGGRGELPQSAGKPSVISERVRTLILCGILKDGNIGYARLLSDLLYKIRHYISDKDLSQLREEVRQLIFEEKAADRAVRAIEILQAYENEKKAKGLVDTEDVLRDCVSIINQSTENPPTSPFVKGGLNESPLLTKGGEGGFVPKLQTQDPKLYNTLVVDGFYDPAPLELQVITALADRAENVFVLAEEDSELHRHFKSSGMTVKRLNGKSRRESIGHYSYPSMENEAEGIAKAVKKRILDGVGPWEIIVTFPALSKYLPMLKRIFRRHGIPLSTDEYDLTSSRPLIVLQEMLMCMEEDYPAKDFLSLLTSPCLPEISSLVKERALTYSYRAGTVKGRESWLSIKDILLRTSGESLSDDEKARLNEFQKEIKKIIDVLDGLKQKKDIISFIDAFESALEKLGYFEYLITPPSPPLKLRGGRGELLPLEKGPACPVGRDAGGSFDKLSSSITSRFTELRRFAGMFQPAESPAFYIKYILQGITGADEEKNSVRALPYELAAGLESREMFFGGLIEGEFPSRPGIDPILPEKVKKELGMPYLEYYLNRQDLYFKRLLNCSVSEPYFSCPSADGDKMFLPSPFLDWGTDPRTLSVNIFTEEDVLVREGEALLSGREPGLFQSAGMFSGGEAISILRRRVAKMSRGFFSVTDIDNYRKCPLRFYIERVLGFKIAEPPQFEVEAMLWGSLAHKTMEHLFKGGEFDLEEMDKRVFQSLELSLRQFPVGEFWSKVAKGIFQRLLPKLKEQEDEIRLQGFRPYKVEEKISAEIGDLRLKGKIDRVDKKKSEVRSQKKITPNSELRTLNSVILLDYKTGGVDDKSLQMPLYAAMWQSSFPEAVEKAGYYSLKDGGVSWHPKKKTMEEFMKGALMQADELVQGINQGRFSPEPSQITECRHCYHSAICERTG